MQKNNLTHVFYDEYRAIFNIAYLDVVIWLADLTHDQGVLGLFPTKKTCRSKKIFSVSAPRKNPPLNLTLVLTGCNNHCIKTK